MSSSGFDLQERSLEIPVNMFQVYAGLLFAQKNEVARAAINVISINTRSGGLSLFMVIFNKRFELKAQQKALFDREWVGKFIRDVILYINAIGFVVVEYVPSDVIEGVMVPQVVRAEHMIPMMVDEPGKQRRWNIYRSPNTTRYFGKGSRKSPLKDLRPRTDVKVYEFFPPMSSGALTSPTIISMSKLRVLDRMWENQEFADFHRAHPIWVLQTPSERTNPDVMDVEHYAERDVETEKGEFRVRRQQQRTKTLQDTVFKAVKTAAEIEAHIVNIRNERKNVSPASGSPSVTMELPPYVYNFEIPEGMTIAVPPRPETVANFSEQANLIWSSIFQVFAIPPQMLNSTHVIHETNAKMTVRLFNESIRDFQEWLQPIIAELFMIVYKNAHKELQNEIADDLINTVNRITEGKETDSAKKKKKKEGKGKSASSSSSSSASINPMKPQNGRFVSGLDFGEPVYKVNPKLLKRSAVISQLEKNMNVVAAFNRTPITEYAELKQLAEDNIISQETLGKHGISVAGLNDSERMNKTEREAEIKRKLEMEKRQAEVTASAKPKSTDSSSSKKRPKSSSSSGGGSSEKAKKSKSKT